MRNEYDFSNAKPGRLSEINKQQITIRIDKETLFYFKGLAEETGVPYQTLINLYLADCAKRRRTLEFKDA